MAYNKKDQEQIKRIAEGLKIPIAEATQIFETDKEIDRGKAQDFDLPKDQVKIGQKYCHTGTRKSPPVYKFDKRERKQNPTKAGIITFLKESLEEFEGVENLEIANKERLITFSFKGENFDLTLIQKRKKKE
jgi:hypothetical protein